MKDNEAIVTAAIVGLFAINVLGVSGVAFAEDKPEKCYGVVKACKNDCQTSSSSRAGTAGQDQQPDAWIYVPEGTCEKIVGGSLAPKV